MKTVSSIIKSAKYPSSTQGPLVIRRRDFEVRRSCGLRSPATKDLSAARAAFSSSWSDVGPILHDGYKVMHQSLFMNFGRIGFNPWCATLWPPYVVQCEP